MDRFLKDVTDNELSPFGGKIVVLGGDFRQCLPVIQRASSAQILNSTIKSSELWDHFSQNTFHLTTNMRSNDGGFSDWLLNIGNGQTPQHQEVKSVNFRHTNIKIVHTEEDLIEEVYGCSMNINTLRNHHSSIILAPKNKLIHNTNEKVLKIIETPSTESWAINHPVVDGNHPIIPDELLEKIQPSGFPPHKLTIKVGAVYMLLRNLNVKKGLCNGSRIVIQSFSEKIITFALLKNDGTIREQGVLLPRITLTPNEEYVFQFQRTQYPVMPAYAGTFQKCQGCTFDKIGIDLREECFTHGQLYVALSRAKNFESIIVLLPEGKTVVKNIVWKQILQQFRQEPINLPPIQGELLPNEDNLPIQPNFDPFQGTELDAEYFLAHPQPEEALEENEES